MAQGDLGLNAGKSVFLQHPDDKSSDLNPGAPEAAAACGAPHPGLLLFLF